MNNVIISLRMIALCVLKTYYTTRILLHSTQYVKKVNFSTVVQETKEISGKEHNLGKHAEICRRV